MPPDIELEGKGFSRRPPLVVIVVLLCAIVASSVGTASAAGAEACPNEAVRVQQRSEGIPDPGECRAYEMVTPPYKSNRIVGGAFGQFESHDAKPGLAAPDGESLLWGFGSFPLDGRTAFPFTGERVRLTRTSEGWASESLLSRTPLTAVPEGFGVAQGGVTASSGDFGVQAMDFNVPLLANASNKPNLYYTRRTGTGVDGYTGWLANAETATAGLEEVKDQAQFNENGSWMARWGNYRGLLGPTATEDPSVTQLEGSAGGNTIYLQHDPPDGPVELVNGCTGSGADATAIPEREGSGEESDVIVSQPCEDGQVTSTRGAAMGGDNGEIAAHGPTATSMSNDGRRLFFESPDPEQRIERCGAATGPATECPPQLFLRQAAPTESEPFAGSVVRWVSRSRSNPVGNNGYDGPMIASQQVGLMGSGIAFEGASKDGSVVYFRTDAPLTPDDPNGAGTPPPSGGVTSGEASTESWDLYQYKVLAAGDPGEGVLTRISGGPAGTADPDTNEAEGKGSAARYISDDGKRVYFVTTSPIPGADNTPPTGGVTTPGGTPGGSVRDLYLYDEEKTGAERYRFIAQLPTEGGAGLNYCSTIGSHGQAPLHIQGGAIIREPANRCFRGTPSGKAVIFETAAQLTADDTNEAGDIYLYDEGKDELVDISVPPPGVSPYGCVELEAGEPSAFCDGDLGFESEFVGESGLGWAGYRHYNLAEDAEGQVSVFFESRLPLTPNDTNGTHWDVYRWSEGELSLISPGDDPYDAYYSGNGSDGRDAFFETDQPIDPREIDPLDKDIYDARIDGGFPFTRPATPCEPLAGQCAGAAPVAPGAPGPSSSAVRGEGNAKPRRCGMGKVLRHGRCIEKKYGQKRKHHKKHHRRGRKDKHHSSAKRGGRGPSADRRNAK